MSSVVIIPSLNPNEKLLEIVKSCNALGLSNIILIDDGSDEKHKYVFDNAASLGAIVLKHEINRGKGAALKTAFAYLKSCDKDYEGCITADSDGQHTPEDILRVAQRLEECKAFVIGVRDFSGKDVPFKSRFGNSFSSFFFRINTGMKCPDTQTGLRGIPYSMLDFALAVEGQRYDYEMNFLMSVAKDKHHIEMLTIQTIYEDNNSVSHFRPIKDSALIYKTPLKFASASLLSAIADLSLFALISFLIGGRAAKTVTVSTVGARVCSGILNFTLNKKWSFNSNGKTSSQALKYFILFLAQMSMSALLVSVFAFIPISLTVIKIIVDTLLFFVSYYIQKLLVFK